MKNIGKMVLAVILVCQITVGVILIPKGNAKNSWPGKILAMEQFRGQIYEKGGFV